MIEYEMKVNDAWDLLDEGEPARAASLAREILSDHPDAIDAFVVLAATSEVAAEAIALLREAVRLGAAIVSQPQIEGKGAGCDKGAHVRALNNLARLLWYDMPPTNRKEALIHARRALHMDHEDRAGTRILLMSWEAAEGNWAAARKLVRSCRKEIRTEVRYWLALHAFRDSASNADALLDKALATNPHVPAALNQRVVLLHVTEEACTYGSPREAALYALDARQGWAATSGAMAWLASRSA